MRQPCARPVCLLVALLFFTTKTECRKVNFYTATPGPSAVSWIRDAEALAGNRRIATGIYFCCVGFFRLEANGTLQHQTAKALSMWAQPTLDAGLDVHFVMDLSQEAIEGRTWARTDVLDRLGQLAVEVGFQGILVDYEPPSNYTRQHEESYAAFLHALSHAMHRVGKQSGFCTSNWGILQAWKIYRFTHVDIATSMVYGWVGDGTPLYDFVEGELAKGGMPRDSVGFGVGTTVIPQRREAVTNFNWTSETLLNFTEWLRLPSVNITRLDFWRTDIDFRWPANATEPWVFRAAADFLSSP